MTLMQTYENVQPRNVKGTLVQTTIDLPTLRKLDALARAHGHKRAGYLRHLVKMHVRSLTPRLARVLAKPSPLDEAFLKITTPTRRKK